MFGGRDDWIFLGCCLSSQGRLVEAREAYHRGTQCEGDPDEAWLNVGLISRALGELEAARDAAVQALEISPEYEAAEDLLADVTAALALEDTDE
jgi:tetratricopeptide (TPR) repeat protein